MSFVHYICFRRPIVLKFGTEQGSALCKISKQLDYSSESYGRTKFCDIWVLDEFLTDILYCTAPQSTDMTYPDDIFKLIFLEAFCCILIQISLIFIIDVSLMISHLLVRQTLGAEQVTSHFLNGLWPIWLWHICATLPRQICNLFHPCWFYQYANWNERYQPTPPLKEDWENIRHRQYHWIGSVNNYRAYSRLAPSQWETSLQSNTASLWLDASLESVNEAIVWVRSGNTAISPWSQLHDLSYSFVNISYYVSRESTTEYCTA